MKNEAPFGIGELAQRLHFCLYRNI